jgi:hypothetical protein
MTLANVNPVMHLVCTNSGRFIIRVNMEFSKRELEHDINFVTKNLYVCETNWGFTALNNE